MTALTFTTLPRRGILALSGPDIMAMGAGGLLKEVPSRPQPRAGAASSDAPRLPRVAALVAIHADVFGQPVGKFRRIDNGRIMFAGNLQVLQAPFDVKLPGTVAILAANR